MDALKELGINAVNPGVSFGVSDWTATKPGEAISSINPSTGEVIAQVNTTSREDYATVIEQSLKAFQAWRQVPAPERGQLVRLIAQELRLYKDALGTLVSKETGKIKQEGDGEVQEMIDMADFAVGQSRMLYGKTMHSERPQHRMYEQWHPLGAIGVITAFNFPVAVWAWNAFIAAICGNTVVWKPSPKVPLCAIAVQKICERIMDRMGHPGIFSLFITRDDTLSSAFVADKRLPLISFTGSVPVGRKINEIVAQRLGKTLLELSGNNAVIIDNTADLNLVVPAIVFGAVGTAGQRCTSIRRVFIDATRYESFIQQLVAVYERIRIGDPLDPNILMGPLIDKPAVEKYLSALTSIKEAGGEIIYGGKVIPGNGYFVHPTIVRAENHWDIVQQETFAPILYVIPYQNLSEAITMQNAVPQGLSSAIFTENLRSAEYFLSALGSDCGIANVNVGTSGAEIGGAFGGEKETGGGREAGSDAWQAYMRRQTSTINWGQALHLAQGIQFDIDSI